MTLLILVSSIILPFSATLFFLLKKQKHIGVLQEQIINLTKKNEFLNSQLEKEIELSEKRVNQIRNLLSTGKFNHIELP